MRDDEHPEDGGRMPEHPTPDQVTLTGVLQALADPVRRCIVRELAEGHAEMACIAFNLPVSKSTATHHFRVLREAGIIRQHYQGTARMSVLRGDELATRFPGLLDSVLAAARQDDAQPPGTEVRTRPAH